MIDPLIGARAIHLAATTIAAGLIFFDVVIAGPALNRKGDRTATAFFATLARWTLIGVVVAVISGFAWALIVAMQVAEAPAVEVLSDGTLTTLLTETRFGQVWLWRGLLAATAILALMHRQRRLALIAASAMLGATAWVGHAGARADAVGWVQVSADMAHLLAAGLWLGSLPALALLLASDFPPVTRTAATRAFSNYGVLAVVTLLVTGVFNTYLLTDSLLALPETTYGRLLLLKIGLFAAMLAFAAVNRWHWTPRLPGQRASRMIRRQSLTETALGLAVIALVGILGTLPPPLHRHIHAGDPPADAAFVHIHDVPAMADVTIRPGQPGANAIEVRLMREDFSLLPAQAVSLQMLRAGQPTVAVEARSNADGFWQAPTVMLPAAGVWTMIVDIRRAAGPPIRLDAPILLNPGSPAKSE